MRLRLAYWSMQTRVAMRHSQVRSEARLQLLVPLALALVLLVLQLQFRAISTTLMIFTGVAVALSGGFLLLWLYGQPWFLDASVWGVELRALFQVAPVNMSVAVWVGFIALAGIALVLTIVAIYQEQLG